MFFAKNQLYSQINEGGMPTSFILNKHQTPILDSYEIKELIAPNMKTVEAEDLVSSDKGKPYRVAVNLPGNFNISNSGTWTELSNGDRIWRFGIKIKDAKALNIYFENKISIPEGGKLHAYNGNHSQFAGAYTSKTDGFKAIEMIQGDMITLEYLMPRTSQELPVFTINSIGYYYRGVSDHIQVFETGRPVDVDRADACQVDVACSEITGWEEQRDAVVKYSFVISSSTFVCSGSVMNNTALDCKPYILSANHCGDPSSSTQITDHIWYFNYQRPSCSVGNTTPYNGAQSQTMQGGVFRASSELGTHPPTTSNQVAGSDFVLVELNNPIPSTYNTYYAGWDKNNSTSGTGVGIHHPSGHEKKISTYSTSTVSTTYNSGWSGAHWRVFWAGTTNGHGVTEGGSSGSPLFNSSGQIIGHLSGGGSLCTATNQPDLYGKTNKAWDQDGTTAASQLKPWLDPNNSGVTSLSGTYAPCSTGSQYCDASSVTCDEYIKNITLGGISNTSVCDNYTHYWQNNPVGISVSSSYLLEISTGIVGSTNLGYTGDQIAVWVDWNSDGDFDDVGENVYHHVVSASTSLPLQSVVAVPSNAHIGETRMRVRIVFEEATEGPILPCGNSNFGEVEDYQLNIGEIVGLKGFVSETVIIYPNPTSRHITIQLNTNDIIEKLTITNTMGQIIHTINNPKTTEDFDFDSFSKGVYFVNIQSENKQIVKKVIVQ